MTNGQTKDEEYKPLLSTSKDEQVSRKIGILLINLGTPDSTSTPDVRRYLREFLNDPRVIDIHPIARWVLLNLVILPFRPAKSAEAYRTIWTDKGSPLLIYGQELQNSLQEKMGDSVSVLLAMRYGQPSIEEGLQNLVKQDVSKILVFPMFPQYSSAANGSAIEKVYEVASKMWNVPPIQVLDTFYDDPGFIEAFRQVAQPVLDDFKPDFTLLSYHGLPERHVIKSDATKQHCLKSETCCDSISTVNRYCYRAHCYATSRALAAALNLSEDKYSVSFQSRLGPTAWIKPYTDKVLPELAEKGVKRLAVMCPAFVADCLETLEEIEIRAAEDWHSLGGEALRLVPSLNVHPAWVEALESIFRNQSNLT